MEKILIKEYEQFNGCPAVKFTLNGISRLDDSGFYHSQMLISWDDRILVAQIGSEIIGVLVYQKSKWQQCYTVIFAFVKPEARKCGIYTKLWKRLVQLAFKDGVEWIIGATHPDNEPMIKAMESTGRKPFRIMYEYQVKAK